MNTKKSNHKLYFLLSIITPFLILCVIFAIKQITPFGTKTLLSGDLLGQYTNFYTELCNKIKSSDSLLFSFTRGLGIDYISESSYYNISPANIIYIFFNASSMPTAISLSVIIKCTLASLCMYTYLIKHYKHEIHAKNESWHLFFVALSCCYALCSYFVNYITNIIWLDSFLIFPLIMLSLEMLVNNYKPYIYTITLSFSILANFYIGYMICLFCIIYFIFLILTTNYTTINNKLNYIKQRCLSFSLYSFIAGGICSFILLPTIYIIASSDSGSIGFYKSIGTYYSSIESFFRQMMSANPTYWHHPYIYSTVLSFLFVPIFFFSTSIPLNKKIGKGLLYIIMIISFQINILDYIWNGFHRVNCFAGRQSFVFIFIVITMIADSFIYGNVKKNLILIFYLLNLCLFIAINIHFEYYATFKCIIKNILLLTLYLFLSLLLTKSNTKHTSVCLISMLIILESTWSSFECINDGITYDDYKSNIINTEKALSGINDISFYRIKNDIKITKNTSALCNYNGISTYSSLTNCNLSDFLYKIGYSVCLNAFDDSSWEPVFSSILGTKYIISSHDYTQNDILSHIYTTTAKPYSKNITSEKFEKLYVYQNNYCLQPAFLINNKVKDFSFEKVENTNPFEFINNFSYSISGNAIYEPVTIFNNTIHAEKGDMLFLYSKSKFENLHFDSSYGHEKLYNNILSGIILIRPQYSDDYIYYVHSSPLGGDIKVKVESYMQSSDIHIYNTNKYIAYTLNIENFKQLMSILSENQLNITSYCNDNIKGTLDANYSGVVMTSIPYSKGWSVYVDGQKVKTYSIHNALLAFDIDKGTHAINIKYFPKGLTIGLTISISCVLLFILLIIYNIRKSSPAKSY